MTQYAIVRRLPSVETAEVEIMRGTACGDSCGSCEVCKYNAKITVEAKNDLYAQVGDSVEIETRSSQVLGAAVLVYVVPFILFFIGYAIAGTLNMGQGASILLSFLFFAVGMLIAVLVAKARRNSPIVYEITKILDSGAKA